MVKMSIPGSARGAHFDITIMIINGYTIDAKLLEKKAIRRCELNKCKGACCADGVWVDLGQAEKILDHAALIQPFLAEERRDTEQWFVELHDDDPSFPSGKYTGTPFVPNPAHPSGHNCIFLLGDATCAIQRASVANGMGPWALKPLYCCAFPIVDEYEDLPPGVKALTVDDTNDLFDRGGGCHELCAPEQAQYMFQIYAEEVVIFLGLDGYRELCVTMGEKARL